MRHYPPAHATLTASLAALSSELRSARTPPALLARMHCVVHALWHHFGMFDGSPRDGHPSMSWVGFYAAGPNPTEMTLVCREPKPACSPIGLHGMCGRGYLQRTTYIVPDIRVLGQDYIACDPKDQSELVVPILLSNDTPSSTCWGVLDLDSYALNAFSTHDASQLHAMLQTANLLATAPQIVAIT